MNVFVAVGAVNTLFLAILVQTKAGKTRADHLLTFNLLFYSVAYAILYGALEYEYEPLFLLLNYVNLLFAPLFYFYAYSMVDKEYRLPKGYLLHFVPLVISYIYLLDLLESLSEVEIGLLYEVYSFTERPLMFNLLYTLDLLYMPIYLVLVLFLLQKHQRQIAESYSYQKSVDYKWIKNLVIVCFVTWLLIDVPLLANEINKRLPEKQNLAIGASLSTLLVYYLGYFGFRQGRVYQKDVKAEDVSKTTADKEKRYLRSGLDAERIESYRRQLISYMETDKPYLNSLLSIRDLSEAIGLSEHNTSEVINIGLKQSFYDFVNSYRVAEFQRRAVLEESKRLTLLAIAHDCGFNSKSSFNRIFKQHTSTTPSAYLQEHSSNAGSS